MTQPKPHARRPGLIKAILLAVYAAAVILLMLLRPLAPALSATGHAALGGVLLAVGIWIGKPFGLPFSIGGLFLFAFMLILGLPPATVFSGMTQSAVWTLIPALLFGFALLKSGLGKRIAFGIVRLFRPSYPAIILSWTLIGIVLSLMTPSVTVRVAIVMPVAVECCGLYGLPKGSRGASLLQLTALSMALLPGMGWLNGSLWGPIIQGMFGAVPELAGSIRFNSWFHYAFLPVEITVLLTAVGGYFVLRPEEKPCLGAALAHDVKAQAPLGRQEIACGVVLAAACLMFVTSSLHHVPDAAVCLIAVVLLFAFRIVETQDFGTAVNWDLVVFVASALSISQIFADTGVSAWLAGAIVPLITPIARHPLLFLPLMTAFIFLWRFVDVALLIPTMALLTPVLPALSAASGLDPMWMIPVFCIAGNAMFLPYQSMWVLMSRSIAKDYAWSDGTMARYGLLYCAAGMIGVTLGAWLLIG